MKHFMLTLIIAILVAHTAWAEVRTINATGEYRMGDHDTRADAKQIALQDAKRIALEKAGTYIESITEVKNFSLSKDEVQAYTAGVVEVTQQAATSIMEGQQQIVRVEVACKIDTDIVTRQIDALRKNETVKAELLKAKQETEQLRQDLEDKTRELAAAMSKTEAERIAETRRAILTEQEVNNLLTQAVLVLFSGNKTLAHGSYSTEGLRRAKILTEQALALDPFNPAVHSIMGLLLAEGANLEEAIAAYRMAARLKPDDADTHYFLGLSSLAKNDGERAIAEFRMAIRLRPNDANTHYFLGNVLYRFNGDKEGAAVEYRAAANLKPDLAVAHASLGEVLMFSDWEGAISALQTAIRLQPNDMTAHYNLGRSLYRKRDLEGAIAEFRTVIRLAPDNPTAHHILGEALKDKGDIDSAIAAYRIAIRLDPNPPTYHYNLGVALEAKRDLKGAIATYRTAIRLSHFYYDDAHYSLGVALQAQGQQAEAARELREYLKRAPETSANRSRIKQAQAALRELE